MGAATRWSGMPNASTSCCEHGASSLHSALGAQAATLVSRHVGKRHSCMT